MDKCYSRAVGIIGVALLLMCLGSVGSVWAGQGGPSARCKSDGDCLPFFHCEPINGGRVLGCVGPGPNPPSWRHEPPQPDFKRCWVDSDCDPGWTCGGAGRPQPTNKGVCYINGRDCFTQSDCPTALTCYFGPNSTGRGECLDARFIPKSQ